MNVKNIKKRIVENEKIRKLMAYGISGVITTIISFVTFKLLLEFMDYIIAFSLSWIIAVTCAYFMTCKRVYNSKVDVKKEKVAEYIRFVLGRVFTYVVNLVLLVIAVEWLKLDEFYSNVVITIVVIILNYFVGDITINKLKLKKERK